MSEDVEVDHSNATNMHVLEQKVEPGCERQLFRIQSC